MATMYHSALKMRDGGRFLARSGQKVLGVSFVLAAMAFSLLPFGNYDLFYDIGRIVISVGLLLLGLTLWAVGAPDNQPELEIDLVRREVRLVRVHGDHRAVLVRRGLHQLARVEMDGPMMRVWQDDHRLMAEVAVTDATTRRRLRDELRAVGHNL